MSTGRGAARSSNMVLNLLLYLLLWALAQLLFVVQKLPARQGRRELSPIFYDMEAEPLPIVSPPLPGLPQEGAPDSASTAKEDQPLVPASSMSNTHAGEAHPSAAPEEAPIIIERRSLDTILRKHCPNWDPTTSCRRLRLHNGVNVVLCSTSQPLVPLFPADGMN